MTTHSKNLIRTTQSAWLDGQCASIAYRLNTPMLRELEDMGSATVLTGELITKEKFRKVHSRFAYRHQFYREKTERGGTHPPPWSSVNNCNNVSNPGPWFKNV